VAHEMIYPPRGRRDPGRGPVQSLGFAAGLGLAVFLALGFAGQAFRNRGPDGARCEPERINPNDAPPASLMRLPGVGLTRARAIVEYRDRSAAQPPGRPAFADGQDIQQVRGFGPATVEEILPWLQFPAPPDVNSRSPGTN
jgi:hypothetical protein